MTIPIFILLLTLLYFKEGQADSVDKNIPDSLVTAQFSIFFPTVSSIIPRRYRPAWREGENERKKRKSAQFTRTPSDVKKPHHEYVNSLLKNSNDEFHKQKPVPVALRTTQKPTTVFSEEQKSIATKSTKITTTPASTTTTTTSTSKSTTPASKTTTSTTLASTTATSRSKTTIFTSTSFLVPTTASVAPSKFSSISQQLQIPSSIIVAGADGEFVEKDLALSTFTEALLVEQGESNLPGIDEDDTLTGDRDDSESDTDTSCYTYTIMLLGQCVVMCQQEILSLC